MRVVHIIVGLDVGGAELMLKRLVLASHANVGQSRIVISLTTMGGLVSRLPRKASLYMPLACGLCWMFRGSCSGWLRCSDP